MKIPEGLKCEITPEMAYPKGVPEIPDGFEFVRFGYAKTGESYLLRSGRYISAASDDSDCPSIIVRKKPQSPPRQWVVEFAGDGARSDFAPGNVPFNLGVSVIREAKPITRQRVDELARRYGPQLHLMTFENFIITVLRALGIEVQD